MRGTVVILRPADGDRTPEVCEFDRPLTLEELQTVIGGNVQAVPSFSTIAFGGVVMDCIALCNEDGKRDHLPINQGATVAWERALRRVGLQLLDDKTKTPTDFLVGNVAVIFGDREFMAEL